MIKRFKITFTLMDEKCEKIKSHDVIEHNNLVHLLMQFQFVVTRVYQELMNEIKHKHNHIDDDDIPF